MAMVIPNGILNMDLEIKDLVKTSLNMGMARLDKDYFNLTLSIRSSLEESN